MHNTGKTLPTGNRRFVLLDANIVAGYYLPESLSLLSARPRIKNIIDAVRNGGAPEVFLYIPEFCIPEVFAVFAKYFFATWDKQVRKKLSKKLRKTDYNKILKEFRDDLHYGALLYCVELNRYHVLATDLISPVDSYYQHYRTRRNAKRTMRKKMMGAADHTIVGMGVDLSRIHGRDNFAVLTSDHRLADILIRATSVRPNTAEKLGLLDTARKLGLQYGKHIYPRVINLAKTTKKELKQFFGVWPLLTTKKRILKKLSASDCQLLATLRGKSGIGRDSLPYTDAFESICREFEQQKAQTVDRHAAWMAIGRVEKRSRAEKKKLNRHTKQRALF